jgi:hypothetical protein
VENVTKFLVYCLEIYKSAYKLSGRQVVALFDQFGVFDYITNYYGALHTTGPQYIIEDISELIEEKRHRQRTC